MFTKLSIYWKHQKIDAVFERYFHKQFRFKFFMLKIFVVGDEQKLKSLRPLYKKKITVVLRFSRFFS